MQWHSNIILFTCTLFGTSAEIHISQYFISRVDVSAEAVSMQEG